MLSSPSRYFLGHHLQTHGLYKMQHNGTVHEFIRKCSPDLILMLR
ncbi:unnamed protein product, partial [Rotaria sp. Silwood2]